MRKMTVLLITAAAAVHMGCAASAACCAGSPVGTPPLDRTASPSEAAYGRLPLAFEENRGQSDPQVKFLSRGRGYAFFLTPTAAVLSLRNGVATTVIRMKLLGANADAEATGLEELSGRSNYIHGSDPARWTTGIPNYARVRYRGVYPGVDLVYYGSPGGGLEYDFVVAPGADPALICLGFEGAGRPVLDREGNLVLHTAGGDVIEHAPIAYQEIGGARRSVAARFRITGDDQVGFSIPTYDRRVPVVIDPVLLYSTYLGGVGEDAASGIAVDRHGSAYVAGWTHSPDFPASTQLGTGANEVDDVFSDAFVTKLDATGTTFLYSTYLGGSGSDFVYGIAVDDSGSAYVTGETTSSDFPTVGPLPVQPPEGGQDAFVAKLDPSGSALEYSTYLGGSKIDRANGIAVDAAGSAYVAGYTGSTDFPTLGAAQRFFRGGFYDGFVTKLSASGSALVYSTYLGGSAGDFATAIAVDSSGQAHVTGVTGSFDFRTTNAVQPTIRGVADAFLVKLSRSGSTLIYSTYLGGSGGESGSGIAVDASGNAYVAGDTDSTDLLTVSPFQASPGGSVDTFVAKLSASGSQLLYLTYLGGAGYDNAFGVAVDGAGDAYVTGATTSPDFPTSSPLQPAKSAPNDAFVTKLDPLGSSLVYSSYLGGSGTMDVAHAIVVDGSGDAYVTGVTDSTDFPVIFPAQLSNAGGSDAFVTKLSATIACVVLPPPIGQSCP